MQSSPSFWSTVWSTPVVVLALFAGFANAQSSKKVPAFDADIKPLFIAKCVACHGSTPQAKLDVRTPEAILKGGASGPAVVPGEAAKSLLIDKIVTGQMPPGKVKLTAAEIDSVRGWIDLGLKSAPVEKVATAAHPVSEIEVRAILQVRCIACHGGTRREGDLDLRTVASRLKGGNPDPRLCRVNPKKA